MVYRSLGVLALAAAVCWNGGCESEADVAEDASGPACNFAEAVDVYSRYVAPITADRASQSCTSCHPGNDLTSWERQTPCHTAACMIEQNMISLVDPESSHVLALTQMGANPTATIDPAVMQREYDGLLGWIEYNTVCFANACGPIADPCGGGSGGAGGGGSGGGGSAGGTGGTWGACAQQDVVAQFQQKVWKWAYKAQEYTTDCGVKGAVFSGTVKGMCGSCHAKAGACDSQTVAQMGELWMDDVDPLTSLKNIVGASLIDVSVPNKSELITKPLGKAKALPPLPPPVPSKIGTLVPVTHEGGHKLDPIKDKQAVDDFVDFIDYYVKCMTE